MTARIRVIPHEAVPLCGSFDVRFPDGRPSRFFYLNDIAGRRQKCKQLSTWHAASDAGHCFYERSLDCIDILQAKIDALLFEQALATEPAVAFDDE
jgi:hypothetical protein